MLLRGDTVPNLYRYDEEPYSVVPQPFIITDNRNLCRVVRWTH